MATRMQQRRGTASQWISSNSGNGPILNAGEIGWESDTNKFKIGDGVSSWANLDYFSDINSTVNPAFGSSITFEGSTANDYETTLQVTDPTADRTITLPNVTGTVITTGNLSDITNIGVFTSSITMEGSSADDFELTLSAGNPTEDRTITFPDATGTVVLTETLGASLGSYLDSSDIGAVDGVAGLDGDKNLLVPGASIIVEGATDNTFETTLTVTNPTADQTITFPNDTGTVQLRVTDVSDTEIGYLNGVTSAIQTQLDDKSTASKTETLTNKTLTSPKINEDVAVTATATELNYVDGVTSAIQTQLNALAPKADPTFTGTVSAADLTLSGNLTVNGTTTNLNSTNLVIEDKNIILGDTGTPTDTTADGGGITLKGATDKTFNWVDATDAWTSSEHINLASGKALYLNGTLLKDATETLTNKTLTSPTLTTPALGTPASGTMTNVTGLPLSTGVTGTLPVANGGTGITALGTGIATALGINTGSAGAPVLFDGALGTPTSGTLTNATGLPVASGISGLGTNVATFLATPTSANFASMISDEIGTGNVLLSDMATNAQAASYTLVLADKAKVVEMSNASANNLTVPLNATVAFPTGTQIHIVQSGAGQTTVVATGGVTINTATTLKLRAQWSAATLIKRAENTWVLVGDLATA